LKIQLGRNNLYANTSKKQEQALAKSKRDLDFISFNSAAQPT
jgi:hypothetical protein